MGSKNCKKCDLLKPLSAFYNEKRNLDGLTGTCKECFDSRSKLYIQANRQEVNAYKSAWRRDNWDKIYSNNYASYFEAAKHRKLLKINRTPKWLSDFQRKQLKNIYKNRPDGYVVDHIVPLQGKNVSGLHVPWNLQYLTTTDNRRKSNHHE